MNGRNRRVRPLRDTTGGMRSSMFILVLGVIGACGGDGGGDGEDAPIDPSEAATICADSCAHELDCDPDTIVAACEADCQSVAAASSEQAFVSIATCMTETPCAGESDVCWDELDPLPEHEQYVI